MLVIRRKNFHFGVILSVAKNLDRPLSAEHIGLDSSVASLLQNDN